MRYRFAMLLVAAVAIFAVSHEGSHAQVVKKGGIEGVKGTVYIIDGNKNKDAKLTIQAHDTVVIEFSYPVNPPLPKSASQKSSQPDVAKGVGIHRVINVKGPLGTGRLGAAFMAEKKGTSTLTFDVSHGTDDIKMTCELEVK